jgi:pyrimidine deaminase RibD-like protein
MNSRSDSLAIPPGDDRHRHRHWLGRAIELSRQCPADNPSFAVGAVIVGRGDHLVTAGYTLELGTGWHAEEIAIHKARERDLDLGGCTLYSSLEPCSIRLSGKRPCVERIIEAGIARVVFALREPPVFVVCEGGAILASRGVEVIHLAELGPAVEAINRRIIRGGIGPGRPGP